MIEKFNQFLFQKVNSSHSQEELAILANKLYLQYKFKEGHDQYLIEDDFKSFANNFFRNLTEEQKTDFEKLSKSKKSLFHLLFHSINGLDQIVNKQKTAKEGNEFLIRYHILSEIQKELFITSSSKTKLETFKLSLAEIANEFEIDKKTLSKWLDLIDLKDKYFGRKQLSFNKYNEIFRKLFLESDEDFDLKNKFEEYNIRLEEKKTLSKKDIIRLGFGLTENPKVVDYERAQEIIQENRNYDFYSTIDKYPYAIAIKIVNYLKSNK